jgi:hypothetical protein
MNEADKDAMAKNALAAMKKEHLESFIDSKEISDEDLKKALLTAVDIDILQHEYQILPSTKK